MSTIEQGVEVDADKLMQFVFRAVDEVGSTLNAALVVMGDKLGLYTRARRRRRPHSVGARRADGYRRALRARVAQRAGGGRLRDLRPGHRPLRPRARAGGRAHGRGEPRLPAGLLPDRAGCGQRLAADHRAGTQRRRPRLARARARRARGLRALLPARLQRQPRRVVAPRARRRGREAGARRERRGRGLWSRLVHGPHGAGVPELDVRRARTTTRARSRPRAGALRRPASATGCGSRWHRPPRTAGATTTS